MEIITPPETTYRELIAHALRDRPTNLTPAEMVQSWIGSAWGDYQETRDPKHLLRVIRFQANTCSGLFKDEERRAIQAGLVDNMIRYIDESASSSGLYYCDSMYELMRVKLPRSSHLLERLDEIKPERGFSEINLRAFRLVLSLAFDNVTDTIEALKLGVKSLAVFNDRLWTDTTERYAIRFAQDFPLELQLVGTAYQGAANFLRSRLDYKDEEIRSIFVAIDSEFEMISRIHKRELPESLGENPPPRSEAKSPRPIRIGSCEKIFAE